MPDVHGLGANNYQFQRVVTLDPSSVPASSLQAETFTVNGLRVNQPVIVSKQTNESGLALVSARVTAANTLELVFFNATAGAVNPASQDFLVVQP